MIKLSVSSVSLLQTITILNVLIIKLIINTHTILKSYNNKHYNKFILQILKYKINIFYNTPEEYKITKVAIFSIYINFLEQI